MKKLKIVTILLAMSVLPFFGWGKSTTIAVGDMVLEPDDFLSFSMEEMIDEIDGYPVLSEYLPDGIDVTWTGKKFKVPKKGKVKYSKKEEDFVTTSDDNPCGFSVSVNKKTGKVKGSFKVYAQKSEKKLKTYTAKISGFLGSDLTVTIKKVGTFTGTLD